MSQSHTMKQLAKVFGLTLLTLTQCNQATERCETYECRRQNMVIRIENQQPIVEEATKLIVYRKEFYLPKMRVFIGEYDSNFELPAGVEPQYFEGTDSLATMNLIFETAGEKVVRGIIEEYQFVSEDSIDSYRYRFELTANVAEQPKKEVIGI